MFLAPNTPQTWNSATLEVFSPPQTHLKHGFNFSLCVGGFPNQGGCDLAGELVLGFRTWRSCHSLKTIELGQGKNRFNQLIGCYFVRDESISATLQNPSPFCLELGCICWFSNLGYGFHGPPRFTTRRPDVLDWLLGFGHVLRGGDLEIASATRSSNQASGSSAFDWE